VICETYGYTRQGYYRHRTKLEQEKPVVKQILTFVRTVRQRQPQVGVKKLHRMLKRYLGEETRIGRDYLYQLLRQHQLLAQKKRRFIATTDSEHQLRIYPNLLPNTEILYPNQVWVSDITYLRTCEGFAYLFLVTDYYSRKIIGSCVTDSLSATGAQLALCKALYQISAPQGIIHHSDHGIQYCCKKYRDILAKQGIRISMTGANHCYDNAVAERVNGILKTEFGLGGMFNSIAVARSAAHNAITIYNTERLHASLNYHTPNERYYAA
jgi:transposase InsO family protein